MIKKDETSTTQNSALGEKKKERELKN